MAILEHADKALVGRMLAADEAAFDQFFTAMFPALYRFALPRVDHREDAAADVAQATLSRAMGKLHTYRAEASLFSWLCTFCRHEIAAYVKREGHSARVDLAEDDPEIRAALESLHSPAESFPDQRLDGQRLATLVQRVLDQLPPHYGDVLEWKYVDGLTVLAIASRMDLSVAATESRLARARRAFRDAFLTLSPELPFGTGAARARSQE